MEEKTDQITFFFIKRASANLPVRVFSCHSSGNLWPGGLTDSAGQVGRSLKAARRNQNGDRAAGRAEPERQVGGQNQKGQNVDFFWGEHMPLKLCSLKAVSKITLACSCNNGCRDA